MLVHSKDLAFESFEDVATFLRAKDTRLVRPSPSDETWARQKSDACGLYLEQAYQILARRVPPNENIMTAAVQVITLCTTDRPKHRAKLTTVTEGVPAAIVSLLSSSSSSYASKAAAAECIWISSFASEPNHQALVKAGAVERLSDIITDNDCNKLSVKEAPQCHLAQMWAAAASQNMAATYCRSDSGRCDWEWTDTKTKDGRHEIVVADKVSYDPEDVRKSLIHNMQLLKALTQSICANVAELDKAPRERTWPSRAKVTKLDKVTPSVAAWGAIGAIRNLALSPEFYEKIPADLLKCLCAHAVRSPDWLEDSKADDAIYRLGFDKKDVCEPLYDRSQCSDYKDWKDEDGEPCRTYEKKRWCAEYSDYAPSNDENYVTAGVGCCACGGGNKKKQSVEDER